MAILAANIIAPVILPIEQWDGGPMTFGITGTFDSSLKVEFQANIKDLDPITVFDGTFDSTNLPAVKIADLDSAMHYTFKISGNGTYDITISVSDEV